MSSELLPSPPVDELVAEYKLLRILTPKLKHQVSINQPRSYYVVEHDDHLYLSLEHIHEERQRATVYQLIQAYQAGQDVDFQALPVELQMILQPEAVPPPLFWGPLIIGGIVGVVIGVVAMAIGMLFLNVTAVTFDSTNIPDSFGLQIPIIIFVFFAAFGWATSSWIVWRRLKSNLLANEV